MSKKKKGRIRLAKPGRPSIELSQPEQGEDPIVSLTRAEVMRLYAQDWGDGDIGVREQEIFERALKGLEEDGTLERFYPPGEPEGRIRLTDKGVLRGKLLSGEASVDGGHRRAPVGRGTPLEPPQ